MDNTIANGVIESIAPYTDVPSDQISLESTFRDLAVDSLEGLSLIMDLEERFKIQIPDEEALAIKTVRQAVESLQRHVAADSVSRDKVEEGS